MSRDTVANALAYCDYGDVPDDVERDLRLTEADTLLATGAVVDIDNLLEPRQRDIWHRISGELRRRGWKPMVFIDSELRLYWVPEAALQKQVEDCLAPYFEVHGGHFALAYTPAVKPGQDDRDADIEFATIQACLDWLDAQPVS